ncbi:GAF domain-containing protein [Thermoactinospora rubra]|uniref:GAF domain-containing protein n=1 Tax=Thermoactinospora rubra TaxID=1088767 RepID=UPI000A0F7968|nr:GAF domain-containing protein [Thermoactinospora rubra]
MPLQNYSLPNSRPDRQAPLTERQLLHSIVQLARHVFGAAASSIFLIDGDTGDLVFEAVAGQGDAHLPGTRFPAGTGIAGWVAMSGQAVCIDDLSGSTHFSRSSAESTGYVPTSLMAAPLTRGGDCVGVLEILDPSVPSRSELADLDVLGLLAVQAAIGLEILIRARHGGTGAPLSEENALLLDRIGHGMRTADEPAMALALTLLTAAEEVLIGGRKEP